MEILLNSINEMDSDISNDIIIHLEKSFGKEAVEIKDPFFIAKYFNLRKNKPFQWIIKRFIDIISSFIGIILTSPILLITAIAIKIESKGPIIFKQKRTGINGEEFVIYKFRSMRHYAEQKLESLIKYNESDNITMFKITNDPRITNVGKFIRKYSIDELPQLFNVIVGNMSLVGPRPLPNKLDGYMSWHYIRFATLPGITGMWQVSGRSDIKDFDNVVKLDAEYIYNWDLSKDMKILAKTVPVVLTAKTSA